MFAVLLRKQQQQKRKKKEKKGAPHNIALFRTFYVCTAHILIVRMNGSFELYKLNPLSPHCGSIARELVHCYTWGRLRIVTVRGNTVGRHR